MAKLLEELEHGTPVNCVPDGKVGDVRGVFALGETRVPKYLLIHWDDTNEQTLLDADEVLSIGDDGVALRSPRKIYEVLPVFDEQNNPLVHRLS